MLSIHCPYCGPRDEDEFVNGGDAHRAPPAQDALAEEWTEYLFFHDNPRGLLAERWQHLYGCRRWFNALRDTVTHRIAATYKLNAPRPETEG